MKPGSQRPAISLDGEQLVVAVRERPVDGDANKALIRALATWLRVPRSCVAIERGAASRLKVIRIDGVSNDVVATALAGLR